MGPFPLGDPADLHDLHRDTVGCLMRLQERHGPVVAYPKGSDLTLFVNGGEASRSLYSDPETFHVYGPPGPRNSAQRRFGLGLFGLNGPKQQEHRRLLMPPVKKPNVEAIGAAMQGQIEGFLSEWRVGQTVDLAMAMKKLSLRIAGRFLFGLEDFAIAEEVAGAFQTWLDEYVHVLFALTLPLEMSGSRYQQWLKAGQQFEVQLQEMAQQRRKILRDDQNDLMAILLRAQQAGMITEAELIGEMQTLFNAAYQTTASGLTWTLLLLLQHPEIAQGILRETSDPARSGQLERAVRESMRILSPVVFVIRRAAKRATMLGHDIAEGTVVVLGIYPTHHDSEVFADPERFHPDRWLDLKPSPYAYIPFGAGPRMCIGSSFSTQLFHQTVTAVLRRFRLALTSGTRVDRHASLTLGVEGRLPVTVLAQDGRGSTTELTGNIHEMVRFPSARPSVQVA